MPQQLNNKFYKYAKNKLETLEILAIKTSYNILAI